MRVSENGKNTKRLDKVNRKTDPIVHRNKNFVKKYKK